MAKNNATESDREKMASVWEEYKEIKRRIAPYVKRPVSTPLPPTRWRSGKVSSLPYRETMERIRSNKHKEYRHSV